MNVVFHLAAKLHINDPSPQLAAEYRRVNVEGTAQLAEAARLAGVRRLVIFSTINVYGCSPPGALLDEQSPLCGDSCYAASKIEAEKIALTTLPAVVLRLAAVYGPSMKGNYPRLLRALQQRRFAFVGKGDNRRTLVHLEDVCAASLLAAEHPRAVGQIYNVTDGRRAHASRDRRGHVPRPEPAAPASLSPHRSRPCRGGHFGRCRATHPPETLSGKGRGAKDSWRTSPYAVRKSRTNWLFGRNTTSFAAGSRRLSSTIRRQTPLSRHRTSIASAHIPRATIEKRRGRRKLSKIESRKEMEFLTIAGRVAAVTALTWLGVGGFRAWAVRRRLLDVPNERSCHVQPTPRGGGLPVALVTILGWLVLQRGSVGAPWNVAAAYAVGAAGIAAVSWFDDLYSLSAIARLAVHALAAFVAVCALGYWQTIPLPSGQGLTLGMAAQ